MIRPLIQVVSMGLILRSNYSFLYNGVWWVHQVLSIYDIIVSLKLYNGE